MDREKILFICTHNSARSQIAEGIINTLYHGRYQGFSAGTEPTGLNPYVVKAMAEIGIDISHHRVRHVREFQKETFDYVVTVCDHARETCPFFPGAKKYLHKGFANPADFAGTDEEIMKRVRQVRDEIKDWLEKTFVRGD